MPEDLAHFVFLEPKVKKEIVDLMVCQEVKEKEDFLDHQALMEYQVMKVLQDLWALREMR